MVVVEIQSSSYTILNTILSQLKVCPLGRHGVGCNDLCKCQNGSACDHVTGACSCRNGWKGTYCDSRKYLRSMMDNGGSTLIIYSNTTKWNRKQRVSQRESFDSFLKIIMNYDEE